VTLPARFAPEDLPEAPGVYLFKGEGGKVLYVGKARSLRDRIRSYARPGGDGRLGIAFLEREATGVDFVVTASESEAVLLEDTLIKRHRPPYNVRLRDDKSFLLVRIDPREEFPRPEPVRAHRRLGQEGGALLFGPYPSTGALRRTLRLLRTIAPLRDCTDAVMRNRSRPCLQHAIGRCCAPCVGLVTPEGYRAHVERAVEFLRGRIDEVREGLRRRMRQEAAALRFERAQALKEQIEALEETAAAGRLAVAAKGDRDAIGLHREGARACVAVLRFRGRLLREARTHLFEAVLPDEELLASFLPRYYRLADVPPEVVLPVEANDREMLEGWLAGRRGGAVSLLVPERGERARQASLASENARRALESAATREAAMEEAAEALADLLSLRKVPETVDGFDVSNLQGAANVASRVRFVGGRPEKRGFRRFRVKGFAGQDDFASMREVVGRALRRDLEADELPDLVVIDGGRGQLAAALEARDEVGAWDVEFVALAKDRVEAGPDDRMLHKGERVFLPGAEEPIPLPEGSPASHLLARIRDEAHRFAVTYHRKVRSRIGSELDGIPGVGPTRRRVLLRHFGSLTALREAPLEAIAGVPGISRPLAEAIHRALRASGEPAP
jgi:excinuclease ABC subunit C